MGIITLLIFISGERTAFINYLLGCSIVISALFLLYPKIRPWLIAGVLLVGGGISVVVIQNPSIKERTIDSCYGYIANWPESGNGRCVRASLRVWTDHSNYVTGIGLRNTRVVLSKPSSDSLRKEYKVSKGSHSHNIYIGWLVGAGVIGLAGFLCFVGFLLVEIARYTLPNRYYMQTIFAFVVLLATFFPLNHGMSFFTNHHAPIIWMTIGWALAYTRSFRNAPPNSIELH
jgi:O-antigen ligase